MEKGRRDHSCCVLFPLICSFCYCLYQYYKPEHTEKRSRLCNTLLPNFVFIVSLICIFALHARMIRHASLCLFVFNRVRWLLPNKVRMNMQKINCIRTQGCGNRSTM